MTLKITVGAMIKVIKTKNFLRTKNVSVIHVTDFF